MFDLINADTVIGNDRVLSDCNYRGKISSDPLNTSNYYNSVYTVISYIDKMHLLYSVFTKVT